MDKIITITDKKLLPEFEANSKVNYGTTSSEKDAFIVYKFVSNNTKVEWGINGYKTKSGDEYLIRTSHEKDGVENTNGKFNTLDKFLDIHSHWQKNDRSVASGYDGDFAGGDWNSINKTYNAFKTTNKKYPSEYPNYYIYHISSQKLYQYTPNNPSIFRKQIRTFRDFYKR